MVKDKVNPKNYPLGSNDLAILNLSKNIGLSTGWMGMTSSLSKNQTISLVGFPQDHFRQLWGMSGNVSQISNPLFNYSNISEFPGQSGSPIFNTSKNIVGINVADANYPNNTTPTHYVPSSLASQYPNYGVQLTTSNINWIQNNVPALKATALYRVYNPNNGEHLYTKNLNEVISLTKVGWNYEGVNSQQPALVMRSIDFIIPIQVNIFILCPLMKEIHLLKRGGVMNKSVFTQIPQNIRQFIVYLILMRKENKLVIFILRVVQNETRLSKLVGDMNKLVGMVFNFI